jgi:hypothetical protein
MAEVISTRQMTRVDKKAAMLEKWLQQWKKVRQKGKYFYILRWGGTMSILFACTDILSHKYHHLSYPKMDLISVLWYLTIYLLCGFSITLTLWYSNEHRYLRARKNKIRSKTIQRDSHSEG